MVDRKEERIEAYNSLERKKGIVEGNMAINIVHYDEKRNIIISDVKKGGDEGNGE